MSEVDKFVMWVNDVKEKYYGVDGERIFENAAQIMSTDKSTGTCTFWLIINQIYIIIILYQLNHSKLLWQRVMETNMVMEVAQWRQRMW